MYRVILFDFFGVFCAPIATNWFKKNVPDHEAKAQAFQALCTESDLGRLTRAAFNQKASELTGIPVPRIIQGIAAEEVIDTDLVAYARGLVARGYRVACLSNGSHEWTLQVINDHELGDIFEKVILSSDLRIVKPDREIYARGLELLDISASEAIFVDDRAANVTGAEACNIRSLLFHDTRSFAKELDDILSAQAIAR